MSRSSPAPRFLHRVLLRLRTTTALLALAGLHVFSVPPAAAQGVINLDQVVVEAGGGTAVPNEGERSNGIADPAPVDGYVATETTAGSKLATPVIEIPQVVSVIGRKELDDLGVQQVDEALRYTPGVFASPFGNDTDTDWSFIRGFQTTQTGLFLDGLPLFQYSFASFIIDPFILDRIEVLNGPSSSLYGGASAGGLVNLSTKRANGKRLRYFETGITDEPNGYGGFDLADSFGEASPWSYRLTGRLKGGDTDVDYADDFRGVIMPSLHYEPDATTRLDLYAIYQRDDLRHTNGFFPYTGTVVNAPYGKIQRDLFASEPGPDDLTSNQILVGYELEHDVNANVTLRSNVRYSRVERDEFQIYPFDFDQSDDVLNRISFAHDTQADLLTADNQAVLKFQTGAFAHKLLTGIDYRYYRIDQTQASGSALALDPISPNYTNVMPPLFSPYLDETLDLNELGVYAQDQIKFGGGFIVTLNGRYDEVWIDRDDRTAFDNDYETRDGSFSGRAGLGYEFANGLAPYVSASRFFEPQIGTATDGMPVGPQDGEQYEAGIKYAPTGIDAIFTASVFDLTRRNTLQSRQIDGVFINEALGEVNSTGVELSAKVDLTDSLNLAASFTTYDIEIKEDANPDFVGNRPFIVPETFASAFLNYTVPTGQLKGVQIGGGVRYVGDSYADNLNRFKVPDVTLFDARLAYEKDNWGVSLNMNNVFDKKYVASCQDTTACYYGEGRRGLLKAHVSF